MLNEAKTPRPRPHFWIRTHGDNANNTQLNFCTTFECLTTSL